MSGWIPTPADGWPSIADALRASGAPWPRAAAITDLRWHADRCDGQVPGRPTLRERWGWPDRAVRALLKAEDAWRDPLKRPASVQRASSRRPAGVQETPRKSAANRSEGPASVQRASSERPADVHTRGGSHSPSPSQIEKTPQPPAERGAAAAGSSERVAWVRARALEQLHQDRDPDALLGLYRTPTGAYVDRWLQATRGETVLVQTLDGPRRERRRLLADAPEGLRRREVRDGLAAAAADWPGRDPPAELRLVPDDDLNP